MSYRHSAKLAAIPPEVDQPQAEATDVGAGFKPALLLATQRPNQPVNYNFRHSLFRPNVEVIAVGNDRDLAWAGAVFFEPFRRIIFHRFLIAANKEHGTFDPFGVLD